MRDTVNDEGIQKAFLFGVISRMQSQHSPTLGNGHLHLAYNYIHQYF